MNDMPRWMPLTLRLAGAYNVSYGLLLSLFPSRTFHWLCLPETPDVMIRCIAMLVAVYGLGYWIAARNPMRYWPLVAVGLAGKILGPVGFLVSLLAGALVLKSAVMIVFNDLIWWWPFWAILLRAWREKPPECQMSCGA